MATTSPTRIDDEIYEAARAVGEVMNRSASQQITHWARIGRARESSPQLAYQDVLAVLKGQVSYDDIGLHEQAVVRAEWDELMEQRIARLDLGSLFEAQGRSYVELDKHGNVVRRNIQDGQ